MKVCKIICSFLWAVETGFVALRLKARGVIGNDAWKGRKFLRNRDIFATKGKIYGILVLICKLIIANCGLVIKRWVIRTKLT